MKYISTRGGVTTPVSSAMAIKQGLAFDGGLFMPAHIPCVDMNFIKELSLLSYPERAARLISFFLTDYTYDELIEDANLAYSNERFDGQIAPVRALDEKTSILELWHGPTCAFKDMALQLMPRLFSRAMKKCGESRRGLILVATSGDTGKAALEGYKDVEGVSVKVFYPTDGVSMMQKLQMQTQVGKNLSVAAIRGNFDDAQSKVKEIFGDEDCKRILNDEGYFLSSANSINFGRLVPQIVYYFSAYVDMCNEGRISFGEKIDVTVPSGNFGNIFAAFIAKKMGLPINKLICASNKNNVLTDFLQTGKYNQNRPFYATSSPSMDILISSNLERLLYTLFGADRCRYLMSELHDKGEYALTTDELDAINQHFIGYCATDDEVSECIKHTYKEKECLIDTHTAVALVATEKYMHEYKAKEMMLVASTASPYKFAHEVLHSILGITEDAISAPQKLEELTGIKMPAPIADLQSKEIIHKDIIDKDDMWLSTINFVKSPQS